MKTHIRSVIKILDEEFGRQDQIRGVEIGVWKGELSERLLLEFPKLTLYLVDPWDDVEQVTMQKNKREVVAAKMSAFNRMRQFLSRAVILQITSVQASKEMWGGTLDFAFIDANHRSVKEDISVWLPHIKSGGILCGHDYNGVGDRRHGWGVKRDVDEAFNSRVNVMPGLVWWARKGNK